MKITVEIPDEEFREEVKRLVVRDAADIIEKDLFGEKHSYNRRVLIDAIKNGVRQLLREHLDDITERAVAAAETTIFQQRHQEADGKNGGGSNMKHDCAKCKHGDTIVNGTRTIFTPTGNIIQNGGQGSGPHGSTRRNAPDGDIAIAARSSSKT